MFINNYFAQDKIIRSLDLLPTDKVDHFIDLASTAEKPITIGFINQHAYNLIIKNNEVAAYFDSLTYRLRDGSGIKMACKLNNCDPGANLNGTDFIPKLVGSVISKEKKCNLFILGTEEPWLSKGSAQLLNGQSGYSLDGFRSDNEYADFIKEHTDDTKFTLIVLAMGMPKQERIAKLLKSQVCGPAVIVCGGAIVDFCAGRFERAPLFFRKNGLEWLYRLIKEPERLFSRYVVGIPKFIAYSISNM